MVDIFFFIWYHVLMKKTKSHNQKKHFYRRNLERIGVILDEVELVKKIQSGRLQFLQRQSNRVTVWLYEFLDKQYKVIYDNRTKNVVTVIPI